ncbi:MAG TPA: delta-60 repeat domain-containing protein [Clostridia bacterium]|nr:delta-60 repeat domain-containing protein [Clostridia bacterium]
MPLKHKTLPSKSNRHQWYALKWLRITLGRFMRKVTPAFWLVTSVACLAEDGTPGSLDTSFLRYWSPGAESLTKTHVAAITQDYKILVACNSEIAKLNQDGSLDQAFKGGVVTVSGGVIYALVVQSNGKVVIAGSFTNVGGISRNQIARLNSDGSVDLSFDPGAGVSGWIFNIGVRLDGKLAIAGNFSTVGGVSRKKIARLHSDGSLDPGFNPGDGTEGSISSLAVQPDGRVVIGGWFSGFNGFNKTNIARLNEDGSVDASFTTSGANSVVSKIAYLSDGSLIVAGGFTTINDASRRYIAKLDRDGNVDPRFILEYGPPDIMGLAVQSDGKVLIGGEFTLVQGIPRSRIARLNADGSVDATFDPGTGIQNSFDLRVCLKTMLSHFCSLTGARTRYVKM